MEPSPLHQRLRAATGSLSFRAIADATGHVPETVRRYMQGHTPSVEFLAALCERFDLSARWLITGQGPMRSADARAHVIREADSEELLGAVTAAIERLNDRVERLESSLRRLERRLGDNDAGNAGPEPSGRGPGRQRSPRGSGRGSDAADER